MIRRLAAVPSLVSWMAWQIVVAAWGVIRAALSPAPIGPPCFVRYPLLGTSDVQATALSWAITVTPATLVVAVGEEELYVHCVLGGDPDEYRAEFAEMERRILRVLAAPSDPARIAAEEKGAGR